MKRETHTFLLAGGVLLLSAIAFAVLRRDSLVEHHPPRASSQPVSDRATSLKDIPPDAVGGPGASVGRESEVGSETLAEPVSAEAPQPTTGREVDGEKVSIGPLVDGVKVGLWSTYVSGFLAWETEYAGGRPDGLNRLWARNGRLLQECVYKDGILDGLSRTWHPTGQVAAEDTFVSGKKEGVCREWSEDGHLKAERTYKAGKLHGECTFYLAGGTIDEAKSGMYEGGVLVVESGG